MFLWSSPFTKPRTVPFGPPLQDVDEGYFSGQLLLVWDVLDATLCIEFKLVPG